jgi:hypothetical protein|nr:MAG TPA: hypothetical protein [Caudoviricetes sp.]
MKWLNKLNPFYLNRKVYELQKELRVALQDTLAAEKDKTEILSDLLERTLQNEELELELKKAQELNNKWFEAVLGYAPTEAILINQDFRAKKLLVESILAKLELENERADDNHA